MIRTQIVINKPKFEQTVTSVSESHPNSMQLVQTFKLIDPMRIEDCRRLVEEINDLQAKLTKIFNYSQADRDIMDHLFDTEINNQRFPQDTVNLAEFKTQMEISKVAFEQMLTLKWAEQSKIDIAEVNINRTSEIVDANEKRIYELKIDVERLRVG